MLNCPDSSNGMLNNKIVGTIINQRQMFEKFKLKAANLGQKMLVSMGQAEEFKEDEDFTTRVQHFKDVRLAIIDLVTKGKKYLELSKATMAAKIEFVCDFFFFLLYVLYPLPFLPSIMDDNS